MSETHEAEAYSQWPPGFRFHPTDDELVSYYLTKKNLDSTFSASAIAEADLNKCEPWDLAAKAKIGEKEWYFFGLRDRKYPRGFRTNRATEAGYWKTTGNDREVFSSRSSAVVGMKKMLVFYQGRAPKGEKTNWVMHEYRLQGKFSHNPQCKNCKDEWVVCRIFEKRTGGKKSCIGLMRRNSFLDLPGSPSLSSLLESPCKITAANDLETRSSESELRTSAKAHDVPCFSTPMEPKANLTGHHLHQFQFWGSSIYADSSDQLSEKAKHMKQSDTRISMNMMPAAALSSVSNIRRDQTLLSMPAAALGQEPGIQHLTSSQPPILCNPHMPLPSSSSNLGFSTDAYFSALQFSNSVSKASVGQSARSPTRPFSSSFVQHKTLSNNITVGYNNCVNTFQCANDAISQNILAQHIQEADGATCLSAYSTHEIASLVCNRLDRSLDKLDSCVTPPVDFGSLEY